MFCAETLSGAKGARNKAQTNTRIERMLYHPPPEQLDEFFRVFARLKLALVNNICTNEAVVLAIQLYQLQRPQLLYGCDSLAFDAFMLGRLRRFHHDCIRRMCRLTRFQTWQHRLSMADMRARPGLHPIDEYIRPPSEALGSAVAFETWPISCSKIWREHR